MNWTQRNQFQRQNEGRVWGNELHTETVSCVQMQKREQHIWTSAHNSECLNLRACVWWQKAGRRGISNRAAIKSSEIGSFVETHTDLETVILSEVRSRKNDHMILLVCGI